MKRTFKLALLAFGLAAPLAAGAASESPGQPRTGGWTDLLGQAGLGAWRGPTGDWRTAGSVVASAADPARLQATGSGQGAIWNGERGRTTDLLTREEWGDLELHLEFLLPKGSNSGVYLMGRYELQVLDSHGITDGGYPGSQCGGIYPRWLDEQNVGGRSPRVNASRPAGEWQSFDITFRAPRFDGRGRKIAHARFVRVLHNGVLVQEEVEVTGPTRAARFESEAEESASGPLLLQGDHGPVAYRGLRVRPLRLEAAVPQAGLRLAAMDTNTKQRYPESDLTLEQQLDAMRAAGFSDFTWDERPPAEMRRVVDAARARGLRLTAIYSGATLARDGLAWSATLPETMRLLQDSGAIVWLHVGSRDFARSSTEGDPVAVPALRRLADLAAANRLRVALYPHVGEWVERVADATRLARRAGHPALGVAFTLCHSLMLGEEARLPELLAEGAPYLFTAQVNGADTAAAGTSWQRLIQPLDRGSFDLAHLLRELRRLEFAGPLALQGYGVKGDPADNLRRSFLAWQRLLASAKQDPTAKQDPAGAVDMPDGRP